MHTDNVWLALAVGTTALALGVVLVPLQEAGSAGALTGERKPTQFAAANASVGEFSDRGHAFVGVKEPQRKYVAQGLDESPSTNQNTMVDPREPKRGNVGSTGQKSPGVASPKVAAMKKTPSTGRRILDVAGGLKTTGKISSDPFEDVLEELVVPPVRPRWQESRRSGEIARRIAASKGNFSFGDDAASRICFSVAFFKESPAGFNLLSDERIHAFVQECRQVYPGIPAAARERLENAHRSGQLPKKLFEIYAPLPQVPVGTCAGPLGPKPFEELGIHAQAYREKRVQPLQEPTIDLSQVGDALKRGEVARFDAAKYLPRWMLNISIPEIAALHGDGARRIPVNFGIYYGKVRRCHEALYELGGNFNFWGPQSQQVDIAIRGLIPWLLEKECEEFFSLEEIARWSKNFRREPFLWNTLGEQPDSAWQEFYHFRERNQSIPSAEINLRRIPYFVKELGPMPFVEQVGLAGEVEHVHSFLWFGTTPGGWHIDACDNVLMQLTTEVDVFVAPANCSCHADPFSNLRTDAGVLSWFALPQPLGSVRSPFFHIHLRPGDGVVIPSGAAHKVMNNDVRRVGLNAFFEPKYGRMQWPSSLSNAFRRNDRDVLAARFLWVSSLRRLWDVRHVSMGFHATRMEMI